jgi:hypothetical protein
MAALPQLSLIAPSPSQDELSVKFMHEDLARSGLTPEDVQAYPISSVRYDGAGAYVLPYRSPLMYRIRIDRATNKYIQPKGIRDIWWPHQRDPRTNKDDVLFIIEGEKKAARFHKRWPNTSVVGIGGAWNGLEQLADGTRRLLSNLQQCLAPEMRVIAIFDGDIVSKPNIQMAATALKHAIKAFSCELEVFRVPEGKGVDDWLEADTAATLTDLIGIPFEQLEESKKQLYKTLGCSLNEDKLILNEINASKILKYYFDGRVYTDKRLGIIKDGELSDPQDLEFSCIAYMQDEISSYYKHHQIRTGMQMALSVRRDLVQEKIQALEWDGTERLAHWGSQYLESAFPAFADDWGRILMTSMGLRILRPGTKCDFACILIGPQGIGKSSFFEDLSKFDGHQFYYAVTDVSGNAGDSNRTQGQMFTKSVVVDLAEGVIFETKKATMDRVKQMLTQTHDEYRVAYSKVPTIEPRGYVFVGTTNRTDQLGDQTGSRRFLNLEVSRITRLPYAEKLQILAEVRHKEAEIRASEWYKLQVTLDQAPQQLRDEHRHITNVQELINAQYHRADTISELLVNLLEAADTAKLRDTDELYITAGYLAARLGEDSSRDKNMCARMLSAAASSPTFPFKLVNQRKRLPQLIMTEGQRYSYTQGINNDQLMINGYIATKKENA